MKKHYTDFLKLPGLMAAALLISMSQVEAQTTITYTFTGAMQTFTVPGCVASVTIVAAGARGVGTTAPYNFPPGNGGWAKGVMSVTSGQVLNIFVGGFNGYNGGGPGLANPSNGGGASDVRTGGIAFTDRVIVAGGGGGAGGDNWACLTGAGNGGGGTPVGTNFVGGEGGAGYTSGTGCGTNGGNIGGVGGNGTHGGGGGGGGLTSGGTGAVSTFPSTAGNGSLGLGGAAGNSAASCVTNGTGGGGGGYWGGGGAAGNNCGAGRGGGGSSWTGILTAPSFTAGTNTGNGIVMITYDFGVPSLTITSTSPTLVCTGTTMTLTATGAPTFTWYNGSQATSIVVTPTANTTYSVASQGTAACPAYGLFPATMIALPVITTTASPNYTICPGTPLTLSAGGADIYSWSGGATNATPFPATATSIYTVTGTNTLTGCSNTNTILVSVHIATVSITPPATICNGASVALNSSTGYIAYSWAWNNTGNGFQSIIVSPSVTTVYTLNATTADFCTASATTTITVNPSPNVVLNADRTHICNGESITLTASGAASYSWSVGGTAASMTASPVTSTMYSVIGTGSNCSRTATVQVIVSACLSVDEMNHAGNSKLLVYPNPNNGEFNVQGKSVMKIELMNELGKLVKVLDLNKNNDYKTHVSDLSNGIYFLVVTGTEENIKYKLVVDK